MIAGVAARNIESDQLAIALRQAHQHAWDLLADLSPSQWTVPYHEGINPPLWELAHMTWFTEWWTLRQPKGGATILSSRLQGADALLDSSKIAHRARWSAAMPSIDVVRAYAAAVLDDVEQQLASAGETDLYFYRLALFHADMHCEALIYLRQNLDLPSIPSNGAAKAQPHQGYAQCAGGPLDQDWVDPAAFAFDNELPHLAAHVAPFSIARRCVTYGEFLVFVQDGGYSRKEFWSEHGWRRHTALKTDRPARWRKSIDALHGWEERWFGSWRPLALEVPLCHVNAYEAEAYCAWAQLRLPTEFEWQWAATSGDIDWGDSVWEWMSDVFAPFQGFVAGPYREYSAPWFGTHRVLRGGAFATHPRIQHPRYRNFYLPERNDVFAGFRTCLR